MPARPIIGVFLRPSRHVAALGLAGVLSLAFVCSLVLKTGRPLTAAQATSASSSGVLNVKSYGARGDGQADDRPAFAKALDALEAAGGGTLVVPPGTYKVQATASLMYLPVPANVTIRGTGGASKLVLQSDDPKAYRELLRVTGDHAALEDLHLSRSGTLGSGVIVKFFPCARVVLRGVTIDGQNEAHPGDVHGIEFAGVPDGRYRDITLDRCTVTRVNYGLFMTNESKAQVKGFIATDCLFQRNRADDLQFNAPSGAMTDITVSGCRFEDNQNTKPSNGAGFGFGLANAQRASLRDCRFENYRCQAVHIEDRSEGVSISGCTFVNCGSEGFAVINIINNSHGIAISENHFDLRDVKNSFPAVKITTGGPKLTYPSEILVRGNVFKLGARYSGVEAFSVPRLIVADNIFEGAGSVQKGKYKGGSNYGITGSNAEHHVVTDNLFKGLGEAFEKSKFPPARFSSVSGNIIAECGHSLTLPADRQGIPHDNVLDRTPKPGP